MSARRRRVMRRPRRTGWIVPSSISVQRARLLMPSKRAASSIVRSRGGGACVANSDECGGCDLRDGFGLLMPPSLTIRSHHRRSRSSE